MGMGPMAGYVDEVPEETIQNTCPERLEAFYGAIDSCVIEGGEDYARDKVFEAFQYGDQAEVADAICQSDIKPELFENSELGGEIDENKLRDEVYRILGLLSDLQRAFEERFPGVTLTLGYHDQEAVGSRYDGVSGRYFHADGVYELTQAGQELEDDYGMTRQFYTTFG